MVFIPNELMDLIFSYIPEMSKLRLNKYFFKKYHHLVRNKIKKYQSEKYIRYMIHRDNDFIIKHLIRENYERWIKLTEYYYDGCDFHNYVNFLIYYCLENHSTNCYNEIKKYQFKRNENMNLKMLNY